MRRSPGGWAIREPELTAILNDELDHASGGRLVRILAALGYNVAVSLVESELWRN